MSFIETDIGFEFKSDRFLAFFGKQESSIQNLKKAYPYLTFKFLHQVHGDEFLYTTSKSDDNRMADAHWTRETKIALVSKTADCIPLLAIKDDCSTVISVHAGWRGVQKRIIPKALNNIGSKCKVFIGPHVMQDSFQIKSDCYKLLKESTSLNPMEWYKDGKVDLLKIVFDQLKDISILPKQITCLKFDTKTDIRFHSFRRDQEKSGRQNSFITLL